MLALELLLCLGGGPQESSAISADGSRLVLDEGHALLELSSPRQQVFVGESFPLVVRFGLERDFLQSNLIQLFLKELDVPVQIQASWFDGQGALSLLRADEQVARGSLRFALGDEVQRAVPIGERIIDGQEFVIFEFARNYRVSEAQELSLAALEMRYAFATEFEESFLSGRSPRNRTDALLRSAGLSLSVKPLPLDKAPIGFSGAIGRFQVTGSLQQGAQLEQGLLRWTLCIEGQGNLSEIKPPALPDFLGFSLLGVLESPTTEGLQSREFVYDLLVRDEMPAVLPVYEFIFFDLEAGEFRSVSTEALPLSSSALHRPAKPGFDDELTAPAPVTAEPSGTDALIALFVTALALLALALLLRGRRSKSRCADPAQLSSPDPRAERQAALTRFLSSDHTQAEDLLQAYAVFLGICLGVQADELQAKGLAARLVREGIALELAQRAEAALGSLLAARYGRGECGAAGQSAPEIVLELSACWAS